MHFLLYFVQTIWQTLHSQQVVDFIFWLLKFSYLDNFALKRMFNIFFIIVWTYGSMNHTLISSKFTFCKKETCKLQNYAISKLKLTDSKTFIIKDTDTANIYISTSTQTSTNTTAWTLDKYGTNAHDAFFYVEVSHKFEVLFYQRAKLKVLINCLIKLPWSNMQCANLYFTAGICDVSWSNLGHTSSIT